MGNKRIKEEQLRDLYQRVLLFKEHLEEDLGRKFYLSVVEHINNYNLLLSEMNKISRIHFDKIDPKIYQLSRKEEERLIEQGIFDQYYGAILSAIDSRFDQWLLDLKNLLHVESKKFVPDEVYKKLPNPIKRMVDEASGCYEHKYLTACAVMLRKVLEDSIYLKFRMKNETDKLYDKDHRRINLDKMIAKAKQLHYIGSQHANRLLKIKLFGDVGAHSFKIELWDEDLDNCIDLIRLVLEELFWDSNKS